MANPQPGIFIKISTELAEKGFARTRIPGECWQVLWVIIRKIYGFKGKYSDNISLSQLSNLTGMKKQNVHRALQKLKQMNIINVIKNDYNSPSEISIKKDYDAWRGAANNVIKKDDTFGKQGVIKKDDTLSLNVIKKDDINVINMETTIDIIDNKDIKKPISLLATLKKDYPAATLIINFFAQTMDKKTRQRLAPKSTTEKINWVETLVRLNEKEDYAFWEIFDIIHFARVEDSEPDKSGFCWKKNLLTIPALYKKTNGARKIEKIRQSLPDDLEPPKGMTEIEYIEKEVKRYAEEIK